MSGARARFVVMVGPDHDDVVWLMGVPPPRFV